MTWTYNAASLSASDLYKVRLAIGDTDSTRQQLQDEEIQFVLDTETIVTLAAAACCDMLAAKYGFQVNTENSELRVSAAARHKHYLELADRLRRFPGDIPGGTGGGTYEASAYAGGTSVAAKEDLEADTDLVPSSFSVGQDDNPDAGDANDPVP